MQIYKSQSIFKEKCRQEDYLGAQMAAMLWNVFGCALLYYWTTKRLLIPGWFEPLLAAHTTMLEISCTGSNLQKSIWLLTIDKTCFIYSNDLSLFLRWTVQFLSKFWDCFQECPYIQAFLVVSKISILFPNPAFRRTLLILGNKCMTFW